MGIPAARVRLFYVFILFFETRVRGHFHCSSDKSHVCPLVKFFCMTRLLKVTAFKSLSYCGLVRTGRHSVVALVGSNTQRRENHAQTSPVRIPPT